MDFGLTEKDRCTATSWQPGQVYKYNKPCSFRCTAKYLSQCLCYLSYNYELLETLINLLCWLVRECVMTNDAERRGMGWMHKREEVWCFFGTKVGHMSH
jgi:hypothetical protein